MVPCLSRARAPHVLANHNFHLSYRLKFRRKEALHLLHNCINFRHMKQIHAKIIRNGLSHDQLLIRKILHLCFSHGEIDYATSLFYQIHTPLTFTWNLMFRAYTIHGHPKRALLLFNLMICHGTLADKFTFPFIIKACTASLSIDLGKVVHGLAIKSGFLSDIFVQNTLIDFYFKCGNMHGGSRVFEKMRARSVVSWTTMIAGLVACGDVDAAHKIFEQMPTKNVVSWTTMIHGYVKTQQPEEVFGLFRRMQTENVRPNEFTLVNLLKACTDLGSLRLGRWIHNFALNNGFELGAFFGTALIDMYSKCGSLSDARRVFDMIQTRSLATWNSMITGLGVHGFGEEAIALFAHMEEKANVLPDAITFVGVLCACVHISNVEEGQKYFNHMTDKYGIAPILEHYDCMIRLYVRANMLGEARKLVDAMPVKPSDDMSSLLKESRLCDTEHNRFDRDKLESWMTLV